MSNRPTTGLQRLVGNSVTGRIQRLIGADRSKQEDKAAPFTLHKEFKEKHVADDAEEAAEVTESRIAAGSGAGIVAGTAPNHLAKEDDWMKAIEASKDQVPPEDMWFADSGNAGPQHVESLTRVEVKGWEAIGKTGQLRVRPMTNKKYVGGEWEVKDCKFEKEDDEEVYVEGSGSVSMSIKHLTSNT